jgi:hypothetical protein
MLRPEDVVAEQALQCGGVADRALLELGDQRGRAPPCRCSGAHVRDGGGHLAGAATTDGAHPALVAGQTPAGMRRGGAGQRPGVGTQPGQEDLGDRPAGGEPHQVEAERGGTDQGVGHGTRLQRWVRPC